MPVTLISIHSAIASGDVDVIKLSPLFGISIHSAIASGDLRCLWEDSRVLNFNPLRHR